MKKHFTKEKTSFSLKLLIFVGLLFPNASINSQIIKKVNFTADSMMQYMLGVEYYAKTKKLCVKKEDNYSFSFCNSDSIVPVELKNTVVKGQPILMFNEYNIYYILKLGENYTYKVLLEFDALGNCSSNIWDIPACKEPKNCQIKIDSIAAKEIAKENNFPKGVSGWKTSLTHDRMSGYMHWQISCVLEIDDSGSQRKTVGTFCKVRTHDGKYFYDKKNTQVGYEFRGKK